MNTMLSNLWQINIEISLLLFLVMLARYAVRKTTKVYNAYLLWLSIPVGVLAAQLISQYRFNQPPIETVNYLVQSYIVQPVNSHSSWGTWAYVWSAIATILLVRLAMQHIQLRRELKSIEAPTKLVGDSKYPIVGIDKDNFSPAVYGFFQPTIYFPIQLEDSLSSDQISLIIQHEEHHISQQHLWLNLMWDILVCCLWFNPLVYMARQGFRHDQELFCDYLVLNKSSQDASRSYGHALLTTVTATHSVSLLCSWKTFNQLEERIMNIKRPSSFSSKIALALAGLVIISGTSIYSVSAAQYANEQFEHKMLNGSSEIVWTTEAKTLIERNGRQFVIDGDQERELTAQEKTTFQAKIEESNRGLQEPLEGQAVEQVVHKIDDHGSSEIVWKTESNTFVQRDGHQYAIDGEQERKLTASEKASFDAKLEQLNRDFQDAEKKPDAQQGQHFRFEIEDQSSETQQRMMIEQTALRQESDRIRRESDQLRRATDAKRIKINQEQSALEQHARNAQQHRNLVRQQARREQKSAERARRDVSRDRRIFERAIEVEREKLVNDPEQQQQREALLAEFEANKEQRISEMAEHRQELEEQHEFSLLDIEEEMAHAEQAIEEARQDIEKSYRNGDIPELQLREMKRSLNRAKQDVQRSRASFETRIFIAPTPPVVPALISQLSVVTEQALPVAAPSTAGSSDTSEQPDYRIYDPRVSQ